MGAFYLAVAIIVLAVIAFVIGRNKALAGVSGNIRELHSLPGYYGHYTAIWCAVPALMIVAVWAVFEAPSFLPSCNQRCRKRLRAAQPTVCHCL